MRLRYNVLSDKLLGRERRCLAAKAFSYLNVHLWEPVRETGYPTHFMLDIAL